MAESPGWAPFRGAPPVEAAGRVWYLVQNPVDQIALASFDAARPARVSVTRLPWEPGDSDDFRYRLSVAAGRPVVVYEMSDDASPQMQAVTVDPAALKVSQPATVQLRTGTNPDYWSQADAATVVTPAEGRFVRYSPTSNTWVRSPAARRGGVVLATIGKVPVEWVGPTGRAGRGAVYVGDKKLGVQLNPAENPSMTGEGPVDTVVPVAVSDSWALLAVHTKNQNDPQAPTTRMLLVKPGSSNAQLVPVPGADPFQVGFRNHELGDRQSGVAGRTGVVNADGACVTVTPAGQLAVSPGESGQGGSLGGFDGQAGYLLVADEEGQVGAVTCPVGGKATPRVQPGALPPALVTQAGAGVFHSRPAANDPGRDRLVFIPRASGG